MAKGGIASMGKRIAPPKFVLFVVLLIGAGIGAGLAANWRHGIMIGFDIAAAIFILSCIPLLGTKAAVMRRHAAENDVNRVALLAITGAVTCVVLVTIGAELLESQSRSGAT